MDELERHPTADDRAGEALLASVREPCTAHQLAYGLGWTLERTADALQRLHARLASTAHTLQQLGHPTYMLAPRPGVVDDGQIARCLRQQRRALDPTAARVLHRALTRPRAERVRNALQGPEERAAAERLIAAGILEAKAGTLGPTTRTEATFAARPDRRRLAPTPAIQSLFER